MDLYFSPLACSMATRIALYEAGDRPSSSRSEDKARAERRYGFLAVNPLGLVPTLRTDEGVIADRERRDPAIRRRAVSESGIGARPGIERTGCINGCASSAPNCTRACSRRCSQEGAGRGEEPNAGERAVAARLPRQLPEGPRIPARPFQRRRRLSRHRDQLDHGDAADTIWPNGRISRPIRRERTRAAQGSP